MLLPQTYMNRSGDAVVPQMKSAGVRFDRLIVIHDELELPFGDIRTKFGGGHKGHNGLRSIMEQGGSGDFHRIRFGIGRPQTDMSVADYVLSDFTRDESARFPELLSRVKELVEGIIAGFSALA